MPRPMGVVFYLSMSKLIVLLLNIMFFTFFYFLINLDTYLSGVYWLQRATINSGLVIFALYFIRVKVAKAFWFYNSIFVKKQNQNDFAKPSYAQNDQASHKTQNALFIGCWHTFLFYIIN